MVKNTRGFALAALASLALAGGACRGSGDDDASTPDGGDNGDGGGGTTIYDVQMGKVAPGTIVTLQNVVVTAIDTYGARVGGIYIEEQAGGPFSGVFVFNPTLPAGLAVGDVVTVAGGAVQEFMPPGDTTPRTLTEISPPSGGMITVTKTGTGTVPAAMVVDPVMLAADDNEAEKWEGVLITFQNVAVTSAPSSVSMTDPLLLAMTVTGPFKAESALAELSVGGTPLARDACLASLTGIGDYFFNYQILPRSEADIVAGGTNCPTENTVTDCQDGADNDHDGFTDCDDKSCQSVAGLDCTVATTVTDIQNGTVHVGRPVSLTGVVVTAVAKFRAAGSTTEEHRIWVADSITAAPYNGVLVFKANVTGMGATIDNLKVGAVVNVTGGQVTEFNGDTEIGGIFDAGTMMTVPPTITATSNTPQTITPVTLTAADLTTPATAEMYEGVVVKIANVKVQSLNPDGAMDFGEWTVGPDAATQVRVDDIMFKRPAALAVGDCYAQVVGPLDFAFANYKIEPRSDADATTAGGVCP